MFTLFFSCTGFVMNIDLMKMTWPVLLNRKYLTDLRAPTDLKTQHQTVCILNNCTATTKMIKLLHAQGIE